MSIIVHVHTGAGFTATARQGAHESQAVANSPAFAAQLAAANLLGLEVSSVAVERKQPGVWVAVQRPAKGARS